MRILIVSDTHGSHTNFEKMLEKEKKADLLIHLGDVEGGEDYMEALLSCPSHILAGNNDFFSHLDREKEFVLLGHRIWLTHGHTQFVNMGEGQLRRVAKDRNIDIVMYGHTHRPSLTQEKDLIILNPGSIAYPRQMGRKATYMVMDLKEGKIPEVELKYIG